MGHIPTSLRPEHNTGSRDQRISGGIGDLAGAESAFREALTAWSAKLGTGHRYTLRATSNLGAVLGNAGKSTEAEQLLRGVVRTRRAAGDSTDDLGATLRNLGLLLYHTGRFAEAERTLLETLSIYRRELPKGHPRLAEALTALGQVLTARGRAQEAEPLLSQAITIRETKLGPHNLRTAECHEALGVAMAALGKRVEAESLFVSSCRAMAADRWGSGQARQCASDLRAVRGIRPPRP